MFPSRSWSNEPIMLKCRRLARPGSAVRIQKDTGYLPAVFSSLGWIGTKTQSIYNILFSQGWMGFRSAPQFGTQVGLIPLGINNLFYTVYEGQQFTSVLFFSNSQSQKNIQVLNLKVCDISLCRTSYELRIESAATTQIYLSFKFCILFSWAWVYSPFCLCPFLIQTKQHCSQGLSLLYFPILLPAVLLPFVGNMCVFGKTRKLRRVVCPGRNVREKGNVTLNVENISCQLAVQLLLWKEGFHREPPALLTESRRNLSLPHQTTSLRKHSDPLQKI